MSYYNARGEKAPDTVKVKDGDSEGVRFNPSLDPAWREENGYTVWKDDDRRAEFDAACANFRSICQQIGEAIGKEDFRGGFDEMVELQQSPIFSTVDGLKLAAAWSGANDLCTYLAAKIGIGQPKWWHECWRGVDGEAEQAE